jgi:HIRAN domain
MQEVEVYWYEDEVWRGNLPTDWRSSLLDKHILKTYVAGIRYFPEAHKDPSFAPGSPLRLIPEPDNAYDPNAVAVWNEVSTQQAGHLPTHIVGGLDTRERHGIALSEQRDADRRVTLGILVSREPVTLRRVGDTHEREAWAARIVARIKAVVAELHEPIEATGDLMKQMWRMVENLLPLQGRSSSGLSDGLRAG